MLRKAIFIEKRNIYLYDKTHKQHKVNKILDNEKINTTSDKSHQ